MQAYRELTVALGLYNVRRFLDQEIIRRALFPVAKLSGQRLKCTCRVDPVPRHGEGGKGDSCGLDLDRQCIPQNRITEGHPRPRYRIVADDRRFIDLPRPGRNGWFAMLISHSISPARPSRRISMEHYDGLSPKGYLMKPSRRNQSRKAWPRKHQHGACGKIGALRSHFIILAIRYELPMVRPIVRATGARDSRRSFRARRRSRPDRGVPRNIAPRRKPLGPQIRPGRRPI